MVVTLRMDWSSRRFFPNVFAELRGAVECIQKLPDDLDISKLQGHWEQDLL